MGYQDIWKILEEIIIELRKNSRPVSENLMNDLKSAKTLIMLMDSSEDRGEIGPKVEMYLASLEANLVTEAQNVFSPDRIDEWLRKLEASSCYTCAGQPQSQNKKNSSSRFVPGLPRDQKWVRVKPIPSLPKAKLQRLAEDLNLVWKDEEEHLIVFGKDEVIREFVKKMTEQASREEPH